MGLLKVLRVFHGDARALPSTYEFKLHVNINIRWLHLLKLGYLVVFATILVFVYVTGGWNYKETGVSSIVIKVAGADVYLKEIWDAVDYVYPPQEVRAFFITTRAAITKQHQGVCPDNHESSLCQNHTDCRYNKRTDNGFQTGKCDMERNMCQIHAWCPVEDLNSRHTKKTKMRGAANFTVYVRDHEEFIKFNMSRSNDPLSIKSSSKCLYHPVNDPTCPVFKIADILKRCGVKYKDVQNLGGIFQFYIKWHCYFNWNSPPCTPRYYFKRIAKDNTGQFSGYNMSYAIYQDINGTKHRELFTVSGLRFLIMIKSIGEKFKFIEFLSSVGSYLSYFGVWSFITGLICAILLVDKRDLLTLDEDAVVRLVRNQAGHVTNNANELEMKMIPDGDSLTEQKDPLIC